MTKNEDVSWIPSKPAQCSLKRFSTYELVTELTKRNGVTMTELGINECNYTAIGPCKILIVKDKS